MTGTFTIQCDVCGWRGQLPLRDPCPSCGAVGGGMTQEAVAELEMQGLSTVGRVNARRGRAVPTMQISRAQDGMTIRVIPPKAERTAKATTASRRRGEDSERLVAELTANGLSTAQIAARLHIGKRWVERLRARSLARIRP